MGKVLGYTRITVPGRTELNNQPAVIKVGGKLLEDKLEDIELNGKGKDAVNPFKGWFTPDTLPAQGSDGDYCYVTDDGVSTIYKWNGEAFVDSEEPVDTSFVQTFATSQSVNNVKIDDTGLENPTTQDETNAPVLAKASDAAILRSKLQTVGFTEEKIVAVTSGQNQNVFDGYVLVKASAQKDCPRIYVPGSGSVLYNAKHIIVDVEGCRSVRFLGIRRQAVSPNDCGYAFYDETNLNGSSFKTDNTGYVSSYAYIGGASEDATAEYVVEVPEDAKYLKISIPDNVMQKFYCYVQMGSCAVNESALEDYGDDVVKNLFNHREFLYGRYTLGGRWVIGAEDPNATGIYGIMSNKLHLKDGETYTVSNVIMNHGTHAVRIVRFVGDDEVFGDFSAFGVPDWDGSTGTVPWRDFGHATFKYNNRGEDYVRVVIRANTSAGENVYLPFSQLEVGNSVTEYAAYNSVRKYDIAKMSYVERQLLHKEYETETEYFDSEPTESGYYPFLNKGVTERYPGTPENPEAIRVQYSSKIRARFYPYDGEKQLCFSGVNDVNYNPWYIVYLSGETTENGYQGDLTDPSEYLGWQFHPTYGSVLKKDRQPLYSIPEGTKTICLNVLRKTEPQWFLEETKTKESSMDYVYGKLHELESGVKSDGSQCRILAIGNSYTEDAFCYVPYLMKNISPETDLTIGVMCLSDSGIHAAYDNWNYALDEEAEHELVDPGAAVQTYADGRSYSMWLYKSKTGTWTKESAGVTSDGLWTIQDALDAYQWDIVANTIVQVTTGDEASGNGYSKYYPMLMRLIARHVSYPVKFVALMTHAGISAVRNSSDDGQEIFQDKATAMEGVLNYTVCEDAIPVFNAVFNAYTSDSLKAIGGEPETQIPGGMAPNPENGGYLSFDSSHLQNGLPRQLAAYTVVYKLLEWMGMKHKSIIGDGSVMNDEYFDGISRMPSDSGNRGLSTGYGDNEDEAAENVRMIQVCAQQACRFPGKIIDINDFFPNDPRNPSFPGLDPVTPRI